MPWRQVCLTSSSEFVIIMLLLKLGNFEFIIIGMLHTRTLHDLLAAPSHHDCRLSQILLENFAILVRGFFQMCIWPSLWQVSAQDTCGAAVVWRTGRADDVGYQDLSGKPAEGYLAAALVARVAASLILRCLSSCVLMISMISFS